MAKEEEQSPDCETCNFADNVTSDCILGGTKDTCDAYEPKTPQLEPDDMFKALYMMIYLAGGWISISKASFDEIPEDAKILPSYDPKDDKFVLETSYQPKPPKRKRGLIKRRKLVLPLGMRN